MAQFPNWLLGRHCSAVITPLTADTSGNLFTTPASSLVGTLESIEIELSVTDENISPMDVRGAHHVIVEDDYSIVLTEILKQGQANILAAFAVAYDFAFLSVTRGIQVYNFYAVRGNYGEGPLVKGKNTARLNLHRINIVGAASVTYG